MSEIGEIKRQFLEGQWKKFIRSITISNIHGWNGQRIDFNFPVCAIVGENGIGKSTFLKAAACAYNNMTGQTFYPSKMYVKTQWDNNSIDGAYIEYVVQEGDRTRSTHWKKTNDWGYTPKTNKPQRSVFFLDVSRTLPLDATAGYAKIAKQSVSENQGNVALNEESLRGISYVLGRSYAAARFTSTDINPKKEVGILTNTFGEVSQFHQGAGEDATLDLFKLLQMIPNYSLLIIDEVEASLHPAAQRRLVQYLLKVARTKKLQIILSTHSSNVLDEIPLEGRIMLLQMQNCKEILYGVSTKFALSSIDDSLHPELYVFVEDDEAETIINEIVKKKDDSGRVLSRISVKPIGPYGVVDTIAKLINENTLPYKGLAIVDGDKIGECHFCYLSIPVTDAPEKQIITDLKNRNWNNLDNRFGMGAGSLFQILDDAMLLPDHHKWTTYIGDYIKKSKSYVWSIMVEEWCKQCLSDAECDNIYNSIVEKLEEE